jgi:hypothetical protein
MGAAIDGNAHPHRESGRFHREAGFSRVEFNTSDLEFVSNLDIPIF